LHRPVPVDARQPLEDIVVDDLGDCRRGARRRVEMRRLEPDAENDVGPRRESRRAEEDAGRYGGSGRPPHQMLHQTAIHSGPSFIARSFVVHIMPGTPFVMAGLVLASRACPTCDTSRKRSAYPRCIAIHAFCTGGRAWMPATSAGMTAGAQHAHALPPPSRSSCRARAMTLAESTMSSMPTYSSGWCARSRMPGP